MLSAQPHDLLHLPALAQIDLNTDFVRAVLNGQTPGRAWVDRLPIPRVAHVLLDYGMSFIWGVHLGELAPALSEHLSQGSYRTRDEWLQVDTRMMALHWDELLEAEPGRPEEPPGGMRVQRYARVNFRFDAGLFRALNPEVTRLPVGWRLRQMSAREFDLSDVSVTPKAFWRHAAQFLVQGGGWCAECDGEVGAIAFASFRMDDRLEIGVETRSAHRGKGLARAAAVGLIRQLLAADITPVWSCRRENTASYELAGRLGFCPTRTVPYYRLPCPATAGVEGTLTQRMPSIR